MPALMPRDVLFDTALLRYCFDAVLAVGVTGNWQQFVPFGHAVVFLDDVSGNVQQPDIRFDACFLAVRVDPQSRRTRCAGWLSSGSPYPSSSNP